jgi:8-oxo-dGTP pyrophosphatase MutT (NUDIX family)
MIEDVDDEWTLPDDLAVVERQVVRVVVRDARGDVLLFRTREFTAPELGEWWELPGGGIDAGETYATAAVRELREETGLIVPVGDVPRPTWRRTATFRYRGRRRLQHEVVVVVRLAVTAPPLDTSAQFDYEVEDYLGHRWWPVADLVASGERFYPGRLPELLPDVLAGTEIDEPFELFS